MVSSSKSAPDLASELRIVGQVSVVSGQAHGRGEAKPLLRRDPQVAVVGEHPRVAAELFGVVGRPAEHLRPPQRDVRPVILAHATGKEDAEEIVTLHPVVERVDQSPKGDRATGPFVQRRHVTHPRTVPPYGPISGGLSSKLAGT